MNRIKIVRLRVLIGAILLGALWVQTVLPRIEGADVELVKEGNFALPFSQMPGPLFSFGQTVVDVGTFYLFCYPFITKGTNQKKDDALLFASWTPIENFALTLNFPVTIKSTIDGVHASGLNDIVLELEYLFHYKAEPTYFTAATAFGSVTFPTGVPAFTYGSPAYFMGFTLSHMTPEWYVFTSGGATITTTLHHTHYGNELLYQGAFGHNINVPLKNWVFLWLVEFDGIASQPDTIKGIEDKNSGGNVIYVTPSLWISNEFTIIQFGISIPIVQHLRGNQDKEWYILNWDFGFTF